LNRGILALSGELRYENKVMDKIWDRKSFEAGEKTE